MATASHTYTLPATNAQHIKPTPATELREFVQDLAEDLRTTGAQMAGEVHTDLFHKHILKLACCYLALIVLLLSGMIPFLYLANYN